MPRWQLGIFDWDGTLADSTQLNYEAMCAVLRWYGQEPPSFDVWRREVTANFMQFYYNHGVQSWTTKEDLNVIWIPYMKARLYRITLHEGAKPLLHCSKDLKIKTAIVSATPHEVLDPQLKELDVLPLINLARGSALDRENVLIETLDFFGTKAEDAFYVDDIAKSCAIAKRLGMTAIGVTTGYNSREDFGEEDQHFIADSLLELISMISG